MNEKSPALQDEDEAQDARVPESTGAPPRDELAELRRQNEELLTKLKYLQAEFENYRKRVDRTPRRSSSSRTSSCFHASCQSSTKWTPRSRRSKERPGKASGWSATTWRKSSRRSASRRFPPQGGSSTRTRWIASSRCPIPS